jgi:Zn-dependent protease with chaperone function
MEHTFAATTDPRLGNRETTSVRRLRNLQASSIKKRSHFLACLVLTLLVAAPTNAQRRGNANLDQSVSLPADFVVDYQLAIAERAQIRGSNSLLESTDYNEAGLRVLSEFVRNPAISSLNLPYQWTFTIVNDGSINAYSLPDGEVSVGSGLAKLIGTTPGMWAAVLSHETAHIARRHWVRKYLYDLYIAAQIDYYSARVKAGDNNANWSLAAIRIAAPLARAKLSRDLEHDADIQGMMLMARAGYHPDYVFALHHLLRATTGDQSHLGAFFSSHPRWETRDQRDDRTYADALAEYDRLWPDPDASPGGRPPLVAFVGKPSSQENEQMRTADLLLPIYCRNATEPLQLAVLFRKDKRLLQTTDEQHRDERGDLVFRQSFDCSEKTEASPVTLHLPAKLVSKDDRKVDALVYVYSNQGSFLDDFRPFAVHFPKP